MARLQDKQYATPSKRKDERKNDHREQLISSFCPPLDTALVEAIWNDTQNYEASFAILKELAAEAEKTMGELETLGDDSLSHAVDEHDPSVSANIDFLTRCFPHLEKEEILSALEQYDNNIEKTTDVLLNTVFLEGEDTASSTSTEEEDRSVKGRGKRRRQRQKKEKQILWSTGLTIAPPANSDAMEFDGLATLPFNYWHQYDDLVEQLEAIFKQVPHSTILGCVQHCRGHFVAAVVKIMEMEPMTTDPKNVLTWQQYQKMDQVKERLTTELVDRTPQVIQRLATAVVLLNSNSTLTIDQMAKDAIEATLAYEPRQLDLAKQFEALRVDQKGPSERLPVIPDYLRMDLSPNGKQSVDDPTECRSMAFDLIMERNELFRKAATAYQASKNKPTGESGVAFYYSNEARKLDSKAREWNMRAARALVREKRLEQNDEFLVDLHGVTVAEARVLIREVVTQWWSRSEIQSHRRAIRPLRIVTGVGNHSERGQSKLLPSALKLLKQEGWKVDQPYPGCIVVQGIKKP